MDKAVCIRCGLLKPRTTLTCARCGLNPAIDELTMAKSIRLSCRYQHDDGEFVSLAELRVVSEQIEQGRPYSFESSEIERLLREKRHLEEGLSAADKLRIVLFVLVLLVPMVLGTLAFLYL